MGTGEPQEALEQAVARRESRRRGIRESGMRCGEGALIYLLFCIHLTDSNFPPKRKCAWRHPWCRSPAPCEGGPAHLQHGAVAGFPKTEHQRLRVLKSRNDNIFKYPAFLWGGGG